MKLVSGLLALAMTYGITAQAVTADEAKLVLKNTGVEMQLFDYDATGNRYAIGTATVRPEAWSGEEMTQYVVRFEPGSVLVNVQAWEYATTDGFSVSGAKVDFQPVGGQFVTGLTGQLEKWNVGSGNEKYYLVFRDSEGKFVHLASVDKEIKAGWNTRVVDGEVQDWYEMRWNGVLVNAANLEVLLSSEEAKAKAFSKAPYKTRNTCPVLVIRDTEDGLNNGKILTAVYGKKDLNPADNMYWCYYYGTQTWDGEGVKLLTKGRLVDLNKYTK